MISIENHYLETSYDNIIDTLKPVDLTSDRVKEIVNDIENYKED